MPMPDTTTRHRHIALLRAINVGGHVVKMDRLRALFTALGFGTVETFIASGNVLFDDASPDASALEARIEAHLHATLGYPVATFLRTPAEMAAAAAHDPFGDEPRRALYVGFLKTAPDEATIARIAALRTDVDELAVRERELYWLCRVPSVESKLAGGVLERTLGAMTVRNVTTVKRLAAKG